MKCRKMVLRRLSIVLCAVFAFMMLSGFTYSPSEKVVMENASFTVTGDGTTSCINLEHKRPDWFPNSLQVDGKWGRWMCDTWQSPLFLLLDTEKYADVHSIKMSVEFYDANHSYEDNNLKNCKIIYAGTDGAKKTMWAKAYTKTGSWVTAEYTINNIDLTNVAVPWGSGYPANIVFLPDTNAVTLADGSTYDGMLIHKVVVEPITDAETYSLKDLNAPKDSGSYAVNSDSVSLVNTTAWGDASGFLGGADTSAIRTVTDANGVTLSGIPSGNINHTDRKVHMVFDVAKFADMKNANLEIVWFDNLDTTGLKKRISLNYASNDLNQWGAYVSQYVGAWQANSGTWKTTVIPLSNCDFSSLNKISKWFKSNVQFDIINAVTDFGTADDTSDDYAGLLISSIKLTQIPEYTFSGLKFTDEDGNEIDALNAGEKFYTDLTVTRAGGAETADVTVFVALYSEGEDGDKLEKISHLTKKLDGTDSETFTNCFINPSDVTGKYVKVLVWDNVNGMVPMANTLTCK